MADTIGFVDGRLKRTQSAGGSGYWHEYALPANIVNVVGTDADYIAAGANTLGGVRMSKSTEKIETTFHMGSAGTSSSTETYWDGASDPILEIIFQLYGAALTEGQTAKFTCVCKYVALGVPTQRTQTVTATVTAPIGGYLQYALLHAEATINWDETDNVLLPGDSVTITINPDDTGTVKDLLVVFLEMKFKKAYSSIEVK